MKGRTFKLDRIEGKFLGVCAGLANYSGIDATIIRVSLVLLTLVGGFPWTVLAYFAAAWLGQPKKLEEYRPQRSRADVRASMDTIDRRMQAIEHYVTSSDSRLAREIEELR